MSDELPKENRPSKTLDERFANRPHTYRRLQQIADEMDQAIAKGATADEAEAMAIEQLRNLGGEMLTDGQKQNNSKPWSKRKPLSPKASSTLKKSNLVHDLWSIGSAGAVAALRPTRS